MVALSNKDSKLALERLLPCNTNCVLKIQSLHDLVIEKVLSCKANAESNVFYMNQVQHSRLCYGKKGSSFGG